MGDLQSQDDDYLTIISEEGAEVTADLPLCGVHPNDILNSATLYYSFKTNISQEVNVSLYNYDSTSWTQINSSVHTSFCSGVYSITDGNDYYPSVSVKLEVQNSSALELNIDQLMLVYNWTHSAYQDPYTYNDIPSSPSDFTLINGTSDWSGDLSFQDGNYTSFNSTMGIAELAFTSSLEMERPIAGDSIDSLTLLYSYKTDFSQQINLSLYNYSSSNWVILDSNSYTSFTNQSCSINHPDFFNDKFEIKIKIASVNDTSAFQLYLDQLKLEYQYTSYIFKSICQNSTELVDEDFLTFESSIFDAYEYPGTETFDSSTDPFGEWVEVHYHVNRIVGPFAGHRNVMRVESGSTSSQAQVHDAESVSYGTIEFWVFADNCEEGYGEIYLRSGGTTIFILRFNPRINHLATYKNGIYTYLGGILWDQWYHVRIDFRLNGTPYMGLNEDCANAPKRSIKIFQSIYP